MAPALMGKVIIPHSSRKGMRPGAPKPVVANRRGPGKGVTQPAKREARD
jgi:hypothetical protein